MDERNDAGDGREDMKQNHAGRRDSGSAAPDPAGGDFAADQREHQDRGQSAADDEG